MFMLGFLFYFLLHLLVILALAHIRGFGCCNELGFEPELSVVTPAPLEYAAQLLARSGSVVWNRVLECLSVKLRCSMMYSVGINGGRK
jgi:hypothetical protein